MSSQTQTEKKTTTIISSFIRKLDIKEINQIKRGLGKNVILRVTFQSRVPLFDRTNLNMLKESISKVMQSEEFMRCHIVKTGESDYFYERVDHEKYDYANVKFLRYMRTKKAEQPKISTETNRKISDLIFDYMATNEIDPDIKDRTLLWKFYFIEIDRQAYIYDIIAQYHHVMVQGPVATMIIFKLLLSFQKLHKSEPVELGENNMYVGCEESFEFSKNYDSLPTIEPIRRPSFVDPKRAKTISMSQPAPIGLEMSDDVICVDSSLRFESVTNLVDASRACHVKYKIWKLSW